MGPGGSKIIPMKLTEMFVNEHALNPSHVATVEVTLPQERERSDAARDDALDGPEPNAMARHGSLRFGIVGRRTVQPSTLRRAARCRPLRAVGEVTLRVESGHPRDYARVELTATDGQRYAAARDTAYVPRPSTGPNGSPTAARRSSPSGGSTVWPNSSATLKTSRTSPRSWPASSPTLHRERRPRQPDIVTCKRLSGGRNRVNISFDI